MSKKAKPDKIFKHGSKSYEPEGTRCELWQDRDEKQRPSQSFLKKYFQKYPKDKCVKYSVGRKDKNGKYKYDTYYHINPSMKSTVKFAKPNKASKKTSGKTSRKTSKKASGKKKNVKKTSKSKMFGFF